MLYAPERHEPLRPLQWDEGIALAAIERIVRDTEAQYAEDRYWPLHPADRQGDSDARTYETALYDGACGVFWALEYLQAVGAVRLSGNYSIGLTQLLSRNRTLLGEAAERDRASFLLGDTPIHMLAFGQQPTAELHDALDSLIAGNIEHPARELMTGSPGTMLAALFLHERTGGQRWSELFQITADRLWAQLEWSPQYQCSYWQQRFDRHPSTYLDAVHGFVAVALPLIRGRHLLGAERWNAWQACIINTVQRTADRDGVHANWRPQLERTPDAGKKLLQFCHGAPGFVICLADLPDSTLDDLLLAAGETIWSAGPLVKGSNLCHGTAGNAYAFLKLYRRTRDSRWLQRARAFAMHGIAQVEEEAFRQGQLRYSLWTGDLGLAIFLWDCIAGEARFPTLDVFYA
jgi:Lanthionine synthetase C-like protein